MFRENRFLDEHQPVRLQFAQQDLGHRLVHAAVEVHPDADVRADGLAHGVHVGHTAIDLVPSVQIGQFLGPVHLHRAGSLPIR
ncbi:hypothetical protein BKN51_19540 [Amycolatopsis sp. BJA-103]|nr:hypothetical protein BKN51_19540 [Amycolatopsis sp. BJA-103]